MSKIKSIEVTIKVYYEDGTSVDRSTWCSGDDVSGVEYGMKSEESTLFVHNTVSVRWCEPTEVNRIYCNGAGDE